MMMPRKLIVFFALIAIGISGCRLRQSGRHGSPLSGVQIADRVRPATVEVLVQYEATGTVTQLEPDTDKLLLALREQIGSGQTSREEAFEKLVNLFYSAPAEFLKEGEPVQVDKKFYSLGSGFIVTPDGYILTNAHVVEPEQEDLKKAAVSSLAEVVDAQSQAIEQAVENELPGQSPTQDAQDRLREVLLEQYANRSQFEFSRVLSVLMTTAHSENGQFQPIPCTLEKAGQPTPGKDVAVLKMAGSDLPTVPLAESLEAGGIRTGADLTVMGYPGSVALFPSFMPGSSVEPSLTSGHVSAVKDMSGGWQVVQTDAAVNPGNSGGPVLNDYGEVVGLATFQLVGTQGVNFAESIDLAWQFLNELQVQPRQSEFTREYTRALEEYERPGHGRSLRMFEKLAAAYPQLDPPREFVSELSNGGGHIPSPDAAAPTASAHGHAPRGLILMACFGVMLVALLALLIVINR